MNQTKKQQDDTNYENGKGFGKQENQDHKEQADYKNDKVHRDDEIYRNCADCPVEKPAARRDYKDTIFRMLFKEKTNMLSLYNALNKTAYTDENSLEITTLENAVYMNYKNDISFVFDFALMIYEHQSTVNPNMPLRNLFYVARVLQGRIRNDNLYGGKLVRIPAPRFVVFYNGTDSWPERQICKLSDAFEKRQGEPELELTVTVYNINWGCNQEIMEACRLLGEYAQYVRKVREYAKRMPFTQAVEMAVDYCIGTGILSDFLTKNRSEAIAVCIYEYDEEKHIKSEREWAYNQGKAEGRSEGVNEMLVKNVEAAMKNFDIDLPRACEGLGISVEEYQKAKAQSDMMR